ncbi:hypothetical protein [Chryseobacterium shandongense]|uniref:hypothetical protein n=1 Tax=Chryseobacterium shandongense TaxID=1493872 RepID=UPI000F4E25EB|nr:hypothetical protein [Chryseobacterium shandongense]AZA56973.1 hypothetical protein EG350_07210 [Chryseobacterium shandongense]
MAKSKSKTFLLSELFEKEIESLQKLEEIKSAYHHYFESVILVIPTMDTLSHMLWAKREKLNFGPYENLTFFEMSNRIYSDLVLLEAAKILFIDHQIKNVTLKMSNHSGRDLTVIDKDNLEIVGEAFNTACSYFQVKMRSELKKFGDGKVGIIAFNSCALDNRNTAYLETKRKQFPLVLFLECKI